MQNYTQALQTTVITADGQYFRFDNAQDSKFYDMHNNPLHEGYIMVDDKSERSGFKPAGKLVF